MILGRAAAVQAHLELVWCPQQAQTRLAGELVSRVCGQMEQIDTGNGGERGNTSVCKAPRGALVSSRVLQSRFYF